MSCLWDFSDILNLSKRNRQKILTHNPHPTQPGHSAEFQFFGPELQLQVTTDGDEQIMRWYHVVCGITLSLKWCLHALHNQTAIRKLIHMCSNERQWNENMMRTPAFQNSSKPYSPETTATRITKTKTERSATLLSAFLQRFAQPWNCFVCLLFSLSQGIWMTASVIGACRSTCILLMVP